MILNKDNKFNQAVTDINVKLVAEFKSKLNLIGELNTLLSLTRQLLDMNGASLQLCEGSLNDLQQ